MGNENWNCFFIEIIFFCCRSVANGFNSEKKRITESTTSRTESSTSRTESTTGSSKKRLTEILPHPSPSHKGNKEKKK
jgi:hypothetical protein